jgi:thiamine biosynthesis lipoprotein
MLLHAFPAMGTEVELLLDVHPSADSELAFARAESEFERLEALLSRFRPDSELSALNRIGALDAGDDLLDVTRLAVEARERTGGRFDPTVHDALVSAGYDRTFAEVSADGPVGPPRRCGGEIRIDGRRIEVEPGFRLDLGGIAKGYAVEHAMAILRTAGPALVNAGGDIAGHGRLWPVGVETGDGQITLGLEDCALATTGRDRRRWRRHGSEAHHLIDPATGSPAESEYLRVTVTAPTAVDAEVLAKAVFLGAEPEGPAVLVTADGRTVLTGGLA